MKCEKHGVVSTFCRYCDLDVIDRQRKKSGMIEVSEDALESIKRMAQEDAKDAARYRWLRENNGLFYKSENGVEAMRVAVSHYDKTTDLWVHANDGLNAYIDAAMQAKP